MRSFFIAGLIALGCSSSPQSVAPAPEPSKPVCVVLSVGGTNGLSHIGVMEVLKEQGVKVDCVIGTSMGALIGGMYAARPEEPLRSQYVKLAKAYEKEATSEGGGLFLLGALVGGVLTAGAGAGAAAVLMGATVSGTMGLSTLTLKQWKRMRRVLRGYFDGQTIEELEIPFRTIFQSPSGEGLEDHFPRDGSLANAVAASIANPLIFSDVRIKGAAQLDPGANAQFAVPIAYACEEFPDHQFLISNATGKPWDPLVRTKCPYQELMLAQVPVDAEKAMRAKGPDFDTLVESGRRAALRGIDFEALGGRVGEEPAECLGWNVEDVEWQVPPTKPNGKEWDGEGSDPDVVLTLRVNGRRTSSPKRQALKGTWTLKKPVFLVPGDTLSVFAKDSDVMADDPIASEKITLPAEGKRLGRLPFGLGSIGLRCIE